MNLIIFDDVKDRANKILDQIELARNYFSLDFEIIHFLNIDQEALLEINDQTKFIFMHANNYGTGPKDVFEKYYESKKVIIVYTFGNQINDWFKKNDWNLYLTAIGLNGFPDIPLKRFFKEWSDIVKLDEKAPPPLSILLHKLSPDNLMALAILCKGFLSNQGNLTREDWICINRTQLGYELEEIDMEKSDQKKTILNFVNNIFSEIFNLENKQVANTLSALKIILET